MQDEEYYEKITQDTSQNPTNDSPIVISMTTVGPASTNEKRGVEEKQDVKREERR